MKQVLLIVLAILTVGFVAFWLRAVKRTVALTADLGQKHHPTLLELAVGFVTNFFDTLGIGSFATTSSIFKLKGIVADEQIPGTMNVGHSLPTVAEAFIYVSILKVDMLTLVLMIAAAVLGAWLGAGVVSQWPRRRIQIGLGLALLVPATLMFLAQMKFVPGGGEGFALSGPLLAIGLVGNFLLGALMTLGIGLYAPCMVLVYFLGMNPLAAFPIMMGSCAFLMPIASVRFIDSGSYNMKTALALTLGGIPAVLIAAFLVKSLPLEWVRWVVICVVLYTSAMLLRSAALEAKRGVAAASG